jgi:hypothetical protein
MLLPAARDTRSPAKTTRRWSARRRVRQGSVRRTMRERGAASPGQSGEFDELPASDVAQETLVPPREALSCTEGHSVLMSSSRSCIEGVVTREGVVTG